MGVELSYYIEKLSDIFRILTRISHQAAENTYKPLILGVEPGWLKIQRVIRAGPSRRRRFFGSVSLLFTQNVTIATLFAPERRFRTPAGCSHLGARNAGYARTCSRDPGKKHGQGNRIE
jgi:hypothetical protein